ncbi:protein LDOC1-like [Bombina bombina]|uniref:protein LDOC1-like n=1 Tax=Bombina bombina TaxID=8345 RepID=UPI00235AB44A|nr:protein LDOC1-like [Bombina bombina]
MDPADLPTVVYNLSQRVDQLSQGLRELQIQNDNLKAIIKDSTPEPQVSLPEKFSGDRSTYRQFKNACNLLFLMRPKTYNTERIKVMTVISFLRGEARTWADLLFENDEPVLGSLSGFLYLNEPSI